MKTNHKPIRDYYDALPTYEQLGESNEGTVAIAFQQLLESCGRQFQWTLIHTTWQSSGNPNERIRLLAIETRAKTTISRYPKEKIAKS